MPRERKAAAKAIGVKYPLEMEARIQAVSAELARRAAGLQPPITSVMTLVTSRGLDVLERELGIQTESKVA